MRTRQRFFLTAVALAGSVLAAGLLTSLSSASDGPITSTLARIGTTWSTLETQVARHVRGPGRSDRLSWFKGLQEQADLLRQPSTVLLGAYDDGLPRSLDGVLALERALGTAFPIVHCYGAWGDEPEQQFPLALASAISGLGSVPLVTWEPWLSAFDATPRPGRGRDAQGLQAVARGDYDLYVDRWAGDAARFGRPLFLRFAHEMNDPYRYPWGPQNNDPADYVAAWRHLVTRFRLARADNVLWVFSPHVAYDGWEAYYPGDGYVDWTGTGTLNYGTATVWSQWQSFDDLYGRGREKLARFGKPVMITEIGSLATGGDRARWFGEALANLPERYPEVKALVFFHVAQDSSTSYKALDWSFVNDRGVAAGIVRSAAGWDRPVRVAAHPGAP